MALFIFRLKNFIDPATQLKISVASTEKFERPQDAFDAMSEYIERGSLQVTNGSKVWIEDEEGNEWHRDMHGWHSNLEEK